MLRHDAPAFYPRSLQQAYEDMIPDEISSEDLAELEACDQWVQMMMQLEEEENEHLIAYALQAAPAAAAYIEQEQLGVGSGHKRHGKGHKKGHKKAPSSSGASA